ncbi:hypothetical protein HZB03_02285 [Candidatus Woesearchaeota archaeon]|nr:hypothetical protein [Candidatus Woesearchaeota archaeon]
MRPAHRNQGTAYKRGNRKEHSKKNNAVAIARVSWNIFWQERSFLVFLYDLLGIALSVSLLLGGLVLVKWTYLGFTPTAKLAFETAQTIDANPDQVTAMNDRISMIKWSLYRWIAGMIAAVAAMLVLSLVVFSVSSFLSASKSMESLGVRQPRPAWKELMKASALGMFIVVLFLCVSLLAALVLRPPVNAIVVLVSFFIFMLWWLVALYEFIITRSVWRSFVSFWVRGYKNILVLCSVGLLVLVLFILGNVILNLVKLASLKAYAFLLVIWIIIDFMLLRSAIFGHLHSHATKRMA